MCIAATLEVRIRVTIQVALLTSLCNLSCQLTRCYCLGPCIVSSTAQQQSSEATCLIQHTYYRYVYKFSLDVYFTNTLCVRIFAILFLQCNLMGHHCSNHTAAEDVWSTKCSKSHRANRSTCVLCKGLLNPCCLCVPLELRVQVDSTHSIGSIIVFITLGRPLGAVLVLSSWS